jgi:hypothetical protein
LLSRTKRGNDRRRMHLHVPWFKCVCLKSVFFNNSYIFVFVFYFIHHDKSRLKARLNDQSFPSKTWSKFSSTKFFDHVNLHQRLCQRTLMDIDGIETHPIFLIDQSKHHFGIGIYHQKVTWENNFDQTLIV